MKKIRQNKKINGQDGPEINTKIDPKNYNIGVDIKRDLNQVIMCLFGSNNRPIQAQNS